MPDDVTLQQMSGLYHYSGEKLLFILSRMTEESMAL